MVASLGRTRLNANLRSSALLVKAHQWKQNRVQGPGRAAQAFPEHGFRNAEAVRHQFDAIVVRTEHQSAGVDRMQDRQVEAHTPAAGNVQERVGIDFAVIGQVYGDMPGAEKVRIRLQIQGKVFGSSQLLFERQRTPLLAQLLS